MSAGGEGPRRDGGPTPRAGARPAGIPQPRALESPRPGGAGGGDPGRLGDHPDQRRRAGNRGGRSPPGSHATRPATPRARAPGAAFRSAGASSSTSRRLIPWRGSGRTTRRWRRRCDRRSRNSSRPTPRKETHFDPGAPMGPLVLLIVLVVVAAWVIAAYNGLIALKNQTLNAFKQIDVQLKRRHYLIPNAVNAVRGAMDFEKSTLEAVIQARK